MYHYKARTYSPTLGRFLQTDPIGYGDGMNWYAYAGNDPVNMRDPWGLESDEIVVNGRRAPSLPDSHTPVPAQSEADLRKDMLPGETKKPIRLRPSTKRYLCGMLSANGFDLPATYYAILERRQFKVRGKSNWFTPERREAENFLYATGNHRSPPSDGSTKAGVYYHQYVKPFFDETSPYSEDALNAGLEGVEHAQISADELK